MELLNMAAKDMQESAFPMHLRGAQCNPGIMPSIIKEVFFPPAAPHEVATLIESALVYQNSANYQMAVRSLEQARSLWRDIEHPPIQTTVVKKTAPFNNRRPSPEPVVVNENKLRPE
jgi:hypothetical protein